MHSLRRAFLVSLTLTFTVMCAPRGHAQAPMGESPVDEWRYYVAAYLPIVQISGTAIISLPTGAPATVPIDLGFEDVGENYDWALAGIFMAKKGSWSFNVDLNHAELSGDQTLFAEVLDDSADVRVHARIDEDEFFAGYQMTHGVRCSEVIFGMRSVHQDIDIDVRSGSEEFDRTIRESWWDPFAGLRYYGPLSERWYLILRGDIGGLGIGSFFTYRINGGVGVLLGRRWDLNLQFKVMGIDYQNSVQGTSDYYKYDAVERSVLFGVGFRF